MVKSNHVMLESTTVRRFNIYEADFDPPVVVHNSFPVSLPSKFFWILRHSKEPYPIPGNQERQTHHSIDNQQGSGSQLNTAAQLTGGRQCHLISATIDFHAPQRPEVLMFLTRSPNKACVSSNSERNKTPQKSLNDPHSYSECLSTLS